MFLVEIIIFIIAALTILLGSHYLLYFSAVYFFSITSVWLKDFLFFGLFFLAISYILASIIARWKDNIFTRAYYFIAGTWLGFLTNLVIASVFTWVVILISNLANFDVNFHIFGLAFFILAIMYSLYGIWKALNPKIKNIAVAIPNLPEQWKGKKIIQLSDIHIGHVNRNGFINKIVAQVNVIRPEMVVITGDLYDGMDGDLDSPTQALANIQSAKGIFYVNGNHETYLGLDIVSAALAKTKITVLKDQVADVDGLKLIGLSYPAQNEEKDIVKVIQALKADFFGKPNVLLYHSPIHINHFKEAGVNLQLSGHTHQGQIFPFMYVTKLVYKGYDYGLHKIGDYTLYTTNGTGTWGPAMRTGNNPEIVVVTLE